MSGKTGDGNAGGAPPRGGRCPVCDKPSDPATRPFCSKRCADVDLNRWLTGRYGIPVVEDDDLPDEGGGEEH